VTAARLWNVRIWHPGPPGDSVAANGPDDRRARWPDPEHPQQVHLDIEVGDLDGGILLREGPHHSVYADPAGHPFCVGIPAEEG
jgi:hypothetical protein